MSAQALVMFNAGMDNKVSTNKSGATTTAYLSKKEYGEKHGVKGQALNRAHLQYRIDRGVNANGNLAAMMTSGQIVAEKQVSTSDGFKVKFTFAKNLGCAPTDPKVEAAKLSDADLLAILEARKAAPAQQPTA